MKGNKDYREEKRDYPELAPAVFGNKSEKVAIYTLGALVPMVLDRETIDRATLGTHEYLTEQAKERADKFTEWIARSPYADLMGPIEGVNYSADRVDLAEGALTEEELFADWPEAE